MDPETKFDFSLFHATGGDHWPFSPYCFTQPGGPRTHLRYAWDYHRRDQVIRPFHRVFKCFFGKHKVDVWYSNFGGAVNAHPHCRYCEFRREPTADELEDVPNFLKRRRSHGLDPS